jgi:hypothetical protein
MSFQSTLSSTNVALDRAKSALAIASGRIERVENDKDPQHDTAAFYIRRGGGTGWYLPGPRARSSPGVAPLRRCSESGRRCGQHPAGKAAPRALLDERCAALDAIQRRIFGLPPASVRDLYIKVHMADLAALWMDGMPICWRQRHGKPSAPTPSPSE